MLEIPETAYFWNSLPGTNLSFTTLSWAY